MRPHFRRSTLVMASTVMVTATSLAACSSGSSAGGADVAESAGAHSGVAHAKAQIATYEKTREHYGTPASIAGLPDLKGKTVWYIPLGTAAPVLKTMGTAIGQAMKNLGATVHVCDGKFTPTTVAQCMSDAGTHNAAAVVVGFVDYNAVPSAFQSLAAKGIPTLVAGAAAPAGVKSRENLGFFDVSPLSNAAFTLMADAAIADSDGTAKVLNVELADSASTVSNTKATNREFAEQCPKCSVTTVSTTSADQAKLGSLVSAKLSANPDTNYLILPQDSFLQATLPGLQSAGFTGKVKVIASGGSPAGLKQTKAEQLAYNIGQGPEQQGWAVADAALRLMSGAKITKQTSGPLRVFTPENVSSLDLTSANYGTSIWYGGDAWKQDFLTAWGVKQ